MCKSLTIYVAALSILVTGLPLHACVCGCGPGLSSAEESVATCPHCSESARQPIGDDSSCPCRQCEANHDVPPAQLPDQVSPMQASDSHATLDIAREKLAITDMSALRVVDRGPPNLACSISIRLERLLL